MKVTIRKCKHQDQELTPDQFNFASTCVLRYMREEKNTYHSYEGLVYGEAMGCDICTTKTTISAIVWFK